MPNSLNIPGLIRFAEHVYDVDILTHVPRIFGWGGIYPIPLLGWPGVAAAVAAPTLRHAASAAGVAAAKRKIIIRSIRKWEKARAAVGARDL